MFWKRAKYILEWTVKTRWTPEIAKGMRELGWRSRRAVVIGLVIGWCTYGVCGLILPSLELPWLRGSLIALGVVTAFELLFAAISKVEQKGSKKNYRLAETFVRLPDGKQARFKACIACYVHPIEPRLELVLKHDFFIFIDLPEELALREAITAFIMARVLCWTHPEAPQKLYAQSGQLLGFALAFYWLATLGGSLMVAASFHTWPWYVPFLVGPGVIWAWCMWQDLRMFPWHWRLQSTLILCLAGNFTLVILLTQFSAAFNIARITP